MEKDKQIAADRATRNGLDGLLPDCPPGSWEQLAQRLDAAATAADASSVSTDEQLRDKLETIVPPLAPGSWEELVNRMEEPAADEIIQQKLTAHQPVAPTSSWAALAARLELIAARRMAISCYKFSEVCLLLTALFLCWHFYQPQRAEQPPIATVLPSFEGYQEFEQPSSLSAEETVASGTTIQIQPEKALVADPKPLPNAPAATPATQLEARTDVAVAALPIPATTVVLGASSAALVPAVAPVAILDYRLNPRPRTGPQPALQLPALNAKADRTLYLRPFISPWDINQVITPRQAVNDIVLERDDRVSYGSSAGILLDVERRKHAMQYGFIYGKRSYIPTVLKEVESLPVTPGPFEPRDTNYSRITFQTISLPISFQRELIDNGRWRLAASAGLAVNVNVWSSFRKSPTFNQDVLDWTRQTVNRFEPRGGQNEDLPYIDAQDLVYPEQGLLQGGSLLANTNLSFSFGFSLERRLSDRFSLYLAPRFSRALYYQKGSGAEPFNDRIHNNSIQFGTRFQLGKQE